MAKTKSASKKKIAKKTPLKAFWNKHWTVITVTVLVVGIFGFICVNKLIVYNQKKQFDAAEKSLDTLYASIINEVGQPTDVKKDKSCGYASTEWGRGRRSCGISYQLSYKVNNSSEANSFRKKIEQQVESQDNTIISAGSLNRAPLEEPNLGNQYSQTNSNLRASLGLLKCDGAYYYGKDLKETALNSDYLRIEKNTSFLVILGCSGDAKAEFYPVKD